MQRPPDLQVRPAAAPMVPIYFFLGAYVDGLVPRGPFLQRIPAAALVEAAAEMYRTCQPAAAPLPQLRAQEREESGRRRAHPADLLRPSSPVLSPAYNGYSSDVSVISPALVAQVLIVWAQIVHAAFHRVILGLRVRSCTQQLPSIVVAGSIYGGFCRISEVIHLS